MASQLIDIKFDPKGFEECLLGMSELVKSEAEYSREELLQIISEIEEREETEKIYGPDWLKRDYRTRKSIKAGELCDVMVRLSKTEAKLKRSRRGSIGYRKTRSRIKAEKRKLHELEEVVKQPLNEYDPVKPNYITIARSEKTHPRVCPKKVKLFKNNESQQWLRIDGDLIILL